tara:strand:+ start:303 stop:1652 length:1350 start_codon:yes stop_codon:yes gene_type:complete
MQSISNIISLNDYFLLPLYLIGIFIISNLIKVRNISKYGYYQYLNLGLFCKLLGVIAFCLIYVYYYQGGDTINYFYGAQVISNLIEQDFEKGIAILFNTDSYFNSWESFNPATGYPPHYMYKDPNTFIICRISVPLYFLGAKSFLISSMLTACFSYIGIWRIYRLFNTLYPGNYKVFSYFILCLPTLIFWGGGIMKDSFVLGSTCWISYNFYMVLIRRQKLISNVIFFIFNLFLILNIKPYIIISLLPGMLFWLNSAYLNQLKSSLTRVFVFPILFVSIATAAFFSYKNLSNLMGVYGDVDSAIQQAQVIQGDLLRDEQYGGNNYNIGQLDGSIGGLISVAPLAIFTALFRPLFWEIGSPTMVLSVVENMILLVFTIIILMRISPIKLLKILLGEPFLLYCFIFTILFAFGVGIAGTNFGALVRYKIPLVPFFFSMIYLLFKSSKNSAP